MDIKNVDSSLRHRFIEFGLFIISNGKDKRFQLNGQIISMFFEKGKRKE